MVLHLDNQRSDLLEAEDALDFNFNDPEGTDSSLSLGVPFQHTLEKPLRIKDLFVVEGSILKNGFRFTINFIYGLNDIAFHLNPRLDQNYIARNCFIDGEWGSEEGFALMKNPLEVGKNFQIQIFVAQHNFMVCVNGYHLFSFEHKVPPENIQKIEIFGDIDLKSALLMASDVYPNHSVMKFKKEFELMHVPFTHLINEELKSAYKINIKGKVKLSPVSFRINLQSSDKVFPHPLIMYHLNVRYTPEPYVVQNTWGYSGEQWDEEIRSTLPVELSPGKYFDMSIYIYSFHSYIVAKGETWSLPAFKTRLDPNNASCVYIQGDIKLKSFKIIPFNN